MHVIKKYKGLEIYFQKADHIDVKTIESDVDLRSFISGMLSYYPWWMVSLYRIREILVGILGLVRHEKPEILPSIKPRIFHSSLVKMHPSLLCVMQKRICTGFQKHRKINI